MSPPTVSVLFFFGLCSAAKGCCCCFFISSPFDHWLTCLFIFIFLSHTACWFLVKEKNTLCAKELEVTNEQACRAAFDCATVPGKSPDAFGDVFYARSDPHSPKGCVRHDLGHRGGVWVWNTHATGGKPASFISPICRKCNHTVVYQLLIHTSKIS